MLDLWLSIEPEVVCHGPAETGKSRGHAERLLWLCETWPGLRVLVVRKTRKSLSQSFCITFERLVLPKGHALLQRRVSPEHRPSYDFPNGSMIVLGTLETPEAYLSTEWDIIWVEEATEVTEHQWELFFRAIRFRTIPHPFGPDPKTGEPRYLNQLVGTCNPDSERHWIQNRAKKRGPDGKPLLRLIQSRHIDNPTFTAQSQARLDRMSGVRRKRLRDGIWCSAEGAVWPSFEIDRHTVADHPRTGTRPDSPMAYKYLVAGVDWGHTHAGAIVVFGVDHDGRMYRTWEIKRVGWGISKWVEMGVEVMRRWKVETFVCDSARPDYIQEFRNAGLPAVGIQKSGTRTKSFVSMSLELVRDRFDFQKDGHARLYFVADTAEDPDPNLVEEGKAVRTEDEIPSYVLKRDRSTGLLIEGEPEENQEDHCIDCLRYAVCYVERYNQHGARGPRTPELGPSIAELAACTPDFVPRDGLEQKILNGDFDFEDEA